MSAYELALQTRRRANLRHLIQALEREGIQSWALQAGILGDISGPELQAIMADGTITDAFAREVEWAMQRPSGWLDRQPEDALDN